MPTGLPLDALEMAPWTRARAGRSARDRRHRPVLGTDDVTMTAAPYWPGLRAPLPPLVGRPVRAARSRLRQTTGVRTSPHNRQPVAALHPDRSPTRGPTTSASPSARYLCQLYFLDSEVSRLMTGLLGGHAPERPPWARPSFAFQ